MHHFLCLLVVDDPMATLGVMTLRGLRIALRELAHHAGRCQPIFAAAYDVDRTPDLGRIDCGGARKIQWPHADLESRTPRLVDQVFVKRRSEEHTSELQSLMRISYAVFCLKQKTH